jgi:hypothetical protein
MGVAADPAHPNDYFALGWDSNHNTAIVHGTVGADGNIAWTQKMSLPRGPSTNDVPNRIQVSPTGAIYVTTDRGLFMSAGTAASGRVAPFQAVQRFAGVSTGSLTIVPGAGGSFRVLVGTNSPINKGPGVSDSVAGGEVYSLDDPSRPEAWRATGFKKYLEDEATRLNKHLPPGAILFPDEDPNDGRTVYDHITSIQADPGDPSAIYVGTGNHVHRFTPNQGWEGLYSGVLNDSAIYGVAFTGKSMHMATCNGFYKAPSCEAGQPVQWHKELINGAKNNGNSPGIAASPYTPGLLVATSLTPGGVIVSRDDGAHWSSVPGTSDIRIDHGGNAFQFLPDGTVLITGNKLIRVNALHPGSLACGPPTVPSQMARGQAPSVPGAPSPAEAD